MKNVLAFIILFVVLGLSAFQCGDPKDCCVTPSCSEVNSLAGTWKLKSYINLRSGREEIDSAANGREVVFIFKDNGKDGTIEGKTYVNTVSGAYTLSDNCRYTIKSFGGTKVGEPGWSGRAWLSTDSTGSYQRVKDELRLYRSKETEIMVFTKQ